MCAQYNRLHFMPEIVNPASSEFPIEQNFIQISIDMAFIAHCIGLPIAKINTGCPHFAVGFQNKKNSDKNVLYRMEKKNRRMHAFLCHQTFVGISVKRYQHAKEPKNRELHNNSRESSISATMIAYVMEEKEENSKTEMSKNVGSRPKWKPKRQRKGKNRR